MPECGTNGVARDRERMHGHREIARIRDRWSYPAIRPECGGKSEEWRSLRMTNELAGMAGRGLRHDEGYYTAG